MAPWTDLEQLLGRTTVEDASVRQEWVWLETAVGRDDVIANGTRQAKLSTL
jgi:hypothetical protein